MRVIRSEVFDAGGLIMEGTWRLVAGMGMEGTVLERGPFGWACPRDFGCLEGGSLGSGDERKMEKGSNPGMKKDGPVMD
jgi:hypothetical protein